MGEVLEHFTAQEGLHLLGECWRVLKPGGTIRVRVPDNARFWRNYLKEFDEAHQRPRQEWTVNHTRWIDLFFRDICVRPKLWRSIGHYHKYMYDEISLIRTLEGVGFIGAERRGFLDSAIEDVRVVETRDDLTVEATKPTTPRSQP
jgi:predicted SAM-dependent methyltransferase